MSQPAKNLLELRRMPRGALVEHLLREVARDLIATGVTTVRNDARITARPETRWNDK
ncbi:hypothetical protein [Burkholderia thailandensis]|uniref:Uncharacterized protein n=1 Tax=Burkholderia thailandensis TaxID=57975 RepID=A0AAW9CK73_BURTH|nr:hypothetical protein [Burkholderia thailandensis]UCR75683.1 hypothetical protein BtTXDOH_34 [Burkholderia phage phiBt-TXDOH]AOI55517.1 hypothetical protein WI24_27695 [Burkholderia thailandensis]MCS3393161.1 hypothetical protein [Burkholderia thailandensis]MCS6426265.1 hypothetical protein [Burkholderia thailandensis]MCS6456496.1 hypothetical protein [Burkholderia thailandensis]